MNIISFVPTGRENAVSRYDIAKAVGISERDVRFKIKEANKELERIGEGAVFYAARRCVWLGGISPLHTAAKRAASIFFGYAGAFYLC